MIRKVVHEINGIHMSARIVAEYNKGATKPKGYVVQKEFENAFPRNKLWRNHWRSVAGTFYFKTLKDAKKAAKRIVY